MTTNTVTLSDGTTANFGSKTQLISTLDVATATLTFKLVTGEVITWAVQGIDNLEDFQKKVYLYGLLEKVKSTLSPSKKDRLEESINSSIEDIKRGNFNVRAAGNLANPAGLTVVMKAFAIARSKQQEAFVHWQNLEEANVIREIHSAWTALTVSEKNAKRKNPFVQLELAILGTKEDGQAGSTI